jgi:2-succinyl-5-enolpyruvyl-6-hydroxy-3-cyclohexene-1-carboxylate synthase
MHPSTAQARVIVDELVRCGVRHVVACPGSRNAPLSMALFDAATRGLLRLHVRIDERSAGFLALGIGKSGAGPAAVCCTSGTAAANFHPAALEAHHSGTPLLLLTADRPVELYGTGANQTIEQRGLYGAAAPCVDMPLAQQERGANAVWRGTVCRAAALARRGPVQVNVPFREPLVPDGSTDWPESLDGRADGRPWTRVASTTAESPAAVMGPRTLVIAGDGVGPGTLSGWPVVAEPTAGVAGLPHGSLLINAGPLPGELRPDEVLVAGRPTLTRGVGAVLRTARRVVVLGDASGWTDPQRVAAEVATRVEPATPDPEWLAAWRHADSAVGDVVANLDKADWSTPVRVVRDVMRALPEGAPLFLGSSNPIRYVDFVAQPGNRPVLANRGVAGIDGSVSTAAGIALGFGEPAYALLGDLTFLHDINGLLIGPAEQRPDVTVIVLNDDGGGIFASLEQGAPEYAASFERVFGTPHHADLGALCAGYGVPHTRVSDLDSLPKALADDTGPRVVEIRVARDALREDQADLFAAVRAAISR